LGVLKVFGAINTCLSLRFDLW